jgi:hypothetical protein
MTETEQSEQPAPATPNRRWGPRRTLAAVAIAAGLAVTGGTAVALAADEPTTTQSDTTDDGETQDGQSPNGTDPSDRPGDGCDGLFPGQPPGLDGEPALPPDETQPDNGSTVTPTPTLT